MTETKAKLLALIQLIMETEFDTPPLKPPLPLPIDTKVVVWQNNTDTTGEALRYAAGISANGKILTYRVGATSWSATAHETVEWDNWRLAED